MKRLNTLFLALLATSQCMAGDAPIRITGLVPATIPGTQKKIAFLKLKFSSKAKKSLRQHLISSQSWSTINSIYQSYPSAIQLGMNKVPVFDQGMQGTCVTFAVTAAIDAMLGMGDEISQLCQLELGTTLQNLSYTESGWNGSWPATILQRTSDFGVVSKYDQTHQGCGGLTEYPKDEVTPENTLSLDEYHNLSKAYIGLESWTSLLEMNQFINNEVNMSYVLNQVKAALNANERVVVGMGLSPFLGLVGMEGVHIENPNAELPDFVDLRLRDSWVMTPVLASLIKAMGFSFLAGHAMVITGYDDNAVAVDSAGIKHRGLIKLRNSWGSNIGDHGDFYMSYDYFLALVIDLKRIRNFY
jgi:hypothetical protein